MWIKAQCFDLYIEVWHYIFVVQDLRGRIQYLHIIQLNNLYTVAKDSQKSSSWELQGLLKVSKGLSRKYQHSVYDAQELLVILKSSECSQEFSRIVNVYQISTSQSIFLLKLFFSSKLITCSTS